MATIPDKYLEQLLAAGLLVSGPYPPGSHCPEGVAVGKPATVAGNYIPGYDLRWGLEEIRVNTPVLWLYNYGNRWYVRCHEMIPGPGPGDFHNEWNTFEEATADVLDFFFGRPDRMEIQRRKM